MSSASTRLPSVHDVSRHAQVPRCIGQTFPVVSAHTARVHGSTRCGCTVCWLPRRAVTTVTLRCRRDPKYTFFEVCSEAFIATHSRSRARLEPVRPGSDCYFAPSVASSSPHIDKELRWFQVAGPSCSPWQTFTTDHPTAMFHVFRSHQQ